MIISLNKDINCDYVCKIVKELIQKNIKSKEQANNTALSITLVEIKDAEGFLEIEQKFLELK